MAEPEGDLAHILRRLDAWRTCSARREATHCSAMEGCLRSASSDVLGENVLEPERAMM
jgi:hypothetical protein